MEPENSIIEEIVEAVTAPPPGDAGVVTKTKRPPLSDRFSKVEAEVTGLILSLSDVRERAIVAARIATMFSKPQAAKAAVRGSAASAKPSKVVKPPPPPNEAKRGFHETYAGYLATATSKLAKQATEELEKRKMYLTHRFLLRLQSEYKDLKSGMMDLTLFQAFPPGWTPPRTESLVEVVGDIWDMVPEECPTFDSIKSLTINVDALDAFTKAFVAIFPGITQSEASFAELKEMAAARSKEVEETRKLKAPTPKGKGAYGGKGKGKGKGKGRTPPHADHYGPGDGGLGSDRAKRPRTNE